MTQYRIKCEKCGNEFIINLDGNRRDRERQLPKYTLCQVCYKAQAEEIERAHEARIAGMNAANGCVPLQGTPKQVAWAESIRHLAIEDIKKQLQFPGHPERRFMESQLVFYISERDAAKIIGYGEAKRRFARLTEREKGYIGLVDNGEVEA